eukprot:969272_1
MADIRSGPPQWIFMAVILGLLVAGGIVFTIQSSSNKKETEQLREKLRTLGAQLDSPNAAQKLHETVQTLTAQLNQKDELVTNLKQKVQTLEWELSPLSAFLVESNQDGGGTLIAQISPSLLAELEEIDRSDKFSVVCKVYFRASETKWNHVSRDLLTLKGDKDADTCMKFSFTSDESQTVLKSGPSAVWISFKKMDRETDRMHTFHQFKNVPIVAD